MKTERVYVLRFNDGSRVPYGVPDFMSEGEAADFQAHVQSELVEGAAQYFEQCCQPAKASENGASGNEEGGGQPTGQPWPERSLTFSDRPSAETLRLQERVNQLRGLGRASLGVRARQRDAKVERRRLEAERAIQLQLPLARGNSRDR